MPGKKCAPAPKLWIILLRTTASARNCCWHCLNIKAARSPSPHLPPGKYMLGFRRVNYESPYLQLIIAANTLNNGYYNWRAGRLTELELLDETLFRPDPWQNAGSVALQYYFSRLYSGDTYFASIGPEGPARVYQTFFGDPWAEPGDRPAGQSSAACSAISVRYWVKSGHIPADPTPVGEQVNHFLPSILPPLLIRLAVIRSSQINMPPPWQMDLSCALILMAR